MIIYTILNLLFDPLIKSGLFGLTAFSYIIINRRYLTNIFQGSFHSINNPVFILLSLSFFSGIINNVLIRPNLVRFAIELTAASSLLAGFLFSLKYINNVNKYLDLINISLLISILASLVYFSIYGFQFSSQEIGRIYSTAGAPYPVKNILVLTAMTFPLAFIQNNFKKKLILLASFFLYIVLSLASGGRSALLVVLGGVIVYVLQTKRFSQILNSLSQLKFHIKLVITKKFLILSSVLILFLLPLYKSIEFIFFRFQTISDIQINGKEMDYPIRIYETIEYLSQVTFSDLIIGRGIGSVTTSPLFSDLTPQLHLSLGHLVFKVGLIGAIILLLYSFVFLYRLQKSSPNKIAKCFVLCILSWIILLEISHTTFMSPYIMFILGSFLPFLRSSTSTRFTHD